MFAEQYEILKQWIEKFIRIVIKEVDSKIDNNWDLTKEECNWMIEKLKNDDVKWIANQINANGNDEGEDAEMIDKQNQQAPLSGNENQNPPQ